MNPILTHALEGLLEELQRLDQLLKALSVLDSRRTAAVLKGARDRFRAVSDSVRAHLQAEVGPALPDKKRQRTLDGVVFSKEDARPDALH